MKTVFIMPLVVATFFAAAAVILAVCGVRVVMGEALTAGTISAGAGILGLIPMFAGRQKDPVGAIQLALVGTVLHLASAVGFAGAAIAMHVVAARLPFVGWLFAGYWVSLMTLIWQLRRMLVTTIGVAKVQQS
ncbi:MAG: hypothetical protein ABSD28_16720 [Tepidisphaeraceae bacterium]|jgi:hypothetical protein